MKSRAHCAATHGQQTAPSPTGYETTYPSAIRYRITPESLGTFDDCCTDGNEKDDGGIRSVIDDTGHKIAVQIDLKRDRDLWDDFYDALTIEQRRRDERIPLREVKKRLVRAGKLRG